MGYVRCRERNADREAWWLNIERHAAARRDRRAQSLKHEAIGRRCNCDDGALNHYTEIRAG
jgi:hypothetical protein